MSMEAHLSELRKKHEALDQRIAEAQRHPSTDALSITALKREKLVLKEEITRLSIGIH